MDPGLLLLLLLAAAALSSCSATHASSASSHTRRLLDVVVPAALPEEGVHPTAWQQSQHTTRRRLLITAIISASGLTDRAGRSNASAAAPAAPPAPAPPPAQAPAAQDTQPSPSDTSSWQRRTLQLPPHVYLISFVMLLAIMVALLSCHCYRMCRIAHRMRVAAELGITLNSAGATLHKRTPQAVIEALPVAKYASVHHARHHKKSNSISSPSKAAALAGSGGSSTPIAVTAAAAAPACAVEGSTTSSGADGSGRGGTRQRGLLMSAALQIREHIARSTGISTLPSTTSTSSGGAATSSGGAVVEITPAPGGLTPPAPASLAAGPSLLAATSLTRKSASAASAAGTGAGAVGGGSSSSGAEPCAICFDEFAPDDDVKQLPCGHFFHPGCIDEWLLRVSLHRGATRTAWLSLAALRQCVVHPCTLRHSRLPPDTLCCGCCCCWLHPQDITCPLCKGMVLDATMLEQQQLLAEALQTSLGSVGSIMQRTQLLARLNQRNRQQQPQEDGQELAQAPASGRQRRSGNRQRRRRLSGLRQHSAPPAPIGLLGRATPVAAEEGAGDGAAGTLPAAATAAGAQQQQQRQQEQQPAGGRSRGGTMQELADLAHIAILGFARERGRARATGAASTAAAPVSAAAGVAAAPAGVAAAPAGGQQTASSSSSRATDIELGLGGSRRG
jgi:hypothetical protein